MFVEQLRRKAESAGGELVDLVTWLLTMARYAHFTEVYTKKPLGRQRYVLRNGLAVVQRDADSAFLARCVMSNTQHSSPIHGNRSRKRHAETRTSSQRLESQEFNAIIRATIGEFSATT